MTFCDNYQQNLLWFETTAPHLQLHITPPSPIGELDKVITKHLCLSGSANVYDLVIEIGIRPICFLTFEPVKFLGVSEKGGLGSCLGC